MYLDHIYSSCYILLIPLLLFPFLPPNSSSAFISQKKQNLYMIGKLILFMVISSYAHFVGKTQNFIFMNK